MHAMPAGPLSDPAPWQVVLAAAAVFGVFAGVAAWRAGGSWRHWSVAVAFGGFAVPWMRWGFEIDGLHGVLMGYLLALILAGQNAIAIGALIVMVGTLRDQNYVRVATRTQGAILGQYLIIALVVGAWRPAAWIVAWLALTAAADLVLRPEGWWECHGVPWLERHDGLSVAIGSAVMTAYPALVVWRLHQGPPLLRHLADGTVAALPVQSVSAEWLLLAWFALWVIPFGVTVGLRERSDALQALAAGVPFTVWALFAFLLGTAARDYATTGLVLSALLGIATWAGVVLRSKAADEDEARQQSWVAEGRAMIYVGPTKKRS